MRTKKRMKLQKKKKYNRVKEKLHCPPRVVLVSRYDDDCCELEIHLSRDLGYFFGRLSRFFSILLWRPPMGPAVNKP